MIVQNKNYISIVNKSYLNENTEQHLQVSKRKNINIIKIIKKPLKIRKVH